MATKQFETPFFIGLILIATALVIFILLPFLGAIVLAITLSILFHPIYSILQRAMPRWPGLAAFMTMLAGVIIILLPLAYFGFKIFAEAQNLYIHVTAGNTGAFLGFVQNLIQKYAPWFTIDFNQSAKQLLSMLAASIGSIFSTLTSLTISFLISIFTFYYLLKDGYRLKAALVKIIPLPHENTEEILTKLSHMANSVIKGSLVVAIVQGILVGLGFFAFGLPNPVLWGSVAIVASLIPVAGTALVLVPGVISLFLSGNVAGAIALGIWGIILVGLADNFLRPYLIERDSKIHPLLALFSVLGGLAVFGVTGLLLGPLILSFFLALLDIYPALILKRNGR
ncbi:MAG: AI-2E family transporter [Parcubacteria group bacterium]|jgi:predicted PurR-regulated permease PerM